jgi:predicted glycosyltransferase involved in capsule biosynthesis
LEVGKTLRDPEIKKRKSLKYSLMEIKGKRLWFQKSKLKWLQEGDLNSNFFHIWVSHRKGKSFTSSINDNHGRSSLNKNISKLISSNIFTLQIVKLVSYWRVSIGKG